MNAALFSLLGLVIGAVLQYSVTRVLEDRRHLRDLRSQSYADFLRAVSDVRHLLIQPQAPREREMLARLTDAKARLCLYGSKEVVALLAEFERLGGTIDTDERRAAFVRVLTAMRHTDDVTGADLASVILGAERALPSSRRLK